jgi:hypothetical protein
VTLCHYSSVGLGTSVGISTRYGLDGPGIESWCAYPSSPVLRPNQLPIQGVPGIYGVGAVKKLGCGVGHPPPSSYEVKERVELHICSLLWAFMALSRVDFIIRV